MEQDNQENNKYNWIDQECYEKQGKEVDHNDFQEIGLSPKKVISRVGFALFILSLVILGVQTLLDVLARSTVPQIIDTDWYIWALTAISIVGIGFPIYYLLMRGIPDSPKGEVVKLKPTRFIMIFFISYMAMYFTNLLSTALTVVIALIKGDEVLNPIVDVILNSNFFITLIYAAVVAPIIEELIFRKLLLDKVRRFGEVPAILITGIAFGLFHMNLSQFFYATVLGFIFAYVVLKTNTIKYAILLHMMINFTSSVMAPVISNQKLIYIGLIFIWIITALTLGVVFLILNFKKIKLEKYEPVMKISYFFFNPGVILYFLSCFIMIISITLS